MLHRHINTARKHDEAVSFEALLCNVLRKRYLGVYTINMHVCVDRPVCPVHSLHGLVVTQKALTFVSPCRALLLVIIFHRMLFGCSFDRIQRLCITHVMSNITFDFPWKHDQQVYACYREG